MLYLANTEAPPIQNKNADAPGIRETTQTALSGACMTLLTSLPLLEVRRMHRPSLFSRIFYTIPACLSTAFSRIFLHIFCGGGETMVVPEVQRVQKMEVYLMDNTKNTKNTRTPTPPTTRKTPIPRTPRTRKTANNFFMSSYKGRGRTAPPFISINAPSCPDTPPV